MDSLQLCSPLRWGGSRWGYWSWFWRWGDKAQVARVTSVGCSGTGCQVVEWKATVKAKKSFPQFVTSSSGFLYNKPDEEAQVSTITTKANLSLNHCHDWWGLKKQEAAQWLSNLSVQQNHLEGLLKQNAGPHAQNFWFSRLWGRIRCWHGWSGDTLGEPLI